MTPEERVGTLIGERYLVDKVIGKGGMGAVLRATHQLTGRRVAVKILLPHLASDEEVLARFFQEARTAAALDHPNVVDTLDMGVEKPTNEAYLVLELLDGQDLGQLLAARGGALPAEELLPIVLPVVDALVAAHEHGIVHRDLKPDNIFIGHDARGREVPKVLDFGIAKLLEGGEAAVHTRTGSVLGTPQYMAPEQALAEGGVGPQTDIWAMGAVLYSCLAGKPAFDAETLAGLMMLICTVDPPHLSVVAPDVDPHIAAVVHKAMRRDLSERFATMEELGAALLHAADAAHLELPAGLYELFETARERTPLVDPNESHTPLATGPIDPAQVELPLRQHTEIAPAGRRRTWLLALPLVAVLAGLGGWWALRDADDTPPPPPPVAPVVETPSLPVGVDPPLVEERVVLPNSRRVTSEPSGAEVWEDGVRLGRTPLDVAIEADRPRTIELRLANRRSTRVTIDEESDPVVSVSLPPSRPRLPPERTDPQELVPR